MAESDVLLQNLSFGTSGTLEQQSELAVTLMASGLCHSVGIDSGEDWDSHDDISEQHGNYNRLFSGLQTLVGSLQNAGLFEDTIVVVLSEMNRTPKRNSDGGKDHWASTSALLIGGGLDGGRVLGGTGDDMSAMGVDLATGDVVAEENSPVLNYDNFVAGVLHAAGVDMGSGEWLPNVEVLHGIID